MPTCDSPLCDPSAVPRPSPPRHPRNHEPGRSLGRTPYPQQRTGPVPMWFDLWVAMDGTTVVSLKVVDDVAAVRVFGRLDQAALQPCRAALDLATQGCGTVVVDLQAATPDSVDSLPLLGAMRRFVVGRRASLCLTAVPASLTDWLEHAGVGHLYALPTHGTSPHAEDPTTAHGEARNVADGDGRRSLLRGGGQRDP